MDAPDNLLENAVNIVRGQMDQLKQSGLLFSESEFHVGLNGGLESLEVAHLLFPTRSQITLHGLQCHTENRTILMLEKWLPGHEDWNVFYFHAKNASHVTDRGIGVPWRACMMRHCVQNWRRCVADLDSGYEVAGAHYMQPPATPPGQHIMAGNFWWAKASYLLTLPSIMDRERIKLYGIDPLNSRYESEVWIGNGPRVPKVRDYHGPGWTPAKIAECMA